jgi:hypothetical protein
MLQWLYTYGASVYSKCFTYFMRMLQMFYLDVVIWCSGYTHMLQIYVSIVSLGFSMLRQVLLPTRSNSRARTRCTHPFSVAYLCHAGTDLAAAAAGIGREASRVGAAACGCADVKRPGALAWPFTICKQPYIKKLLIFLFHNFAGIKNRRRYLNPMQATKWHICTIIYLGEKIRS